MLPRPQVSMQSAERPGWVGSLVLGIATAALWASCSSPEAFHTGNSLSTGSGGASGAAGVTAVSGAGGTAVSGAAGDPGGAGDGGGLAGTSGGAAGTGAAGTSATGAAGTGAAGTSVAGTTGGGAGTGAAGTAAAGTGAAGSGAAGTTPPQTTLSLPMTLSDYFAMTGGMGDAAIVGSVTATTTATACAGEPAAANVGTCFSITYQPQPIAAGAPSTWAGFFWQYPANNWGGTQPQLIAPGAKAVTFYAKGMAGGEKLTFKAGGIVNTPSVTTPFSDSFTISNVFTLTTTWTKYTLPMTGVTYGSGVLGAFAWVAEVPNTTPVRFLLHGVVWE